MNSTVEPGDLKVFVEVLRRTIAYCESEQYYAPVPAEMVLDVVLEQLPEKEVDAIHHNMNKLRFR
jgi:hypothetical protein